MGCPCSSADTCGCFFTATGGITASGVGSEENPLELMPAEGSLFTAVCTSTSRPSPQTDRVIFETDTGRVRIWNGNRWRLVQARPNAVDVSVIGSALSGTTTGQVKVNTLTPTSPWDASDTFLTDARATVVVAGHDNDIWDVRAVLDGVEVDKCRLDLAPSGWGTAKVGCRFGGNSTLDIWLTYVGGSGVYQTFNSPASSNRIEALVYPN